MFRCRFRNIDYRVKLGFVTGVGSNGTKSDGDADDDATTGPFTFIDP